MLVSRCLLELFFGWFFSFATCREPCWERKTQPADADKSEPKPWVRKVAFGILAHDIGLSKRSDRREWS